MSQIGSREHYTYLTRTCSNRQRQITRILNASNSGDTRPLFDKNNNLWETKR